MRGLRGGSSALLLLASVFNVGQNAVRGQTVEVDLQPCIITDNPIESDAAGASEAHVFSELFKGLWASSQLHMIPGSQTLDLTVDETHGLCSVILVGIAPSDTQKTQLTLYSRVFKVRIVYLDAAGAAEDDETMEKLGLRQSNEAPGDVIALVKLTDAALPRVVNPALQTDPWAFDSFTGDLVQSASAPGGAATIVADYADAAGESLSFTDEDGTHPSVAVVTYTGDLGEEEMYVFFAVSYEDVGSWAWAHYIIEWGTNGIFAGERRFWLGAMVEDMFLETSMFEFAAENNEGEEVRMTGGDLEASLLGEFALNAKFNAEIVTEYPFNALGILEKVETTYAPPVVPDDDAPLLDKGSPPDENQDGTSGLPPIRPPTWFSQQTLDGMKSEFEAGLWEVDDLFMAALSLKEDFFWHSNSLSPLARDNLGTSDCNTQDGVNARIAALTGLSDTDTYSWRSMSPPGTTGLFNENCLSSAEANLMTCAPGDNAWDGVQTTANLVNKGNQFHSIYTTLETNGYEGFQIVPRFSTNIFSNCVSTECIILESVYTRRVECGCTDDHPGYLFHLNTDPTGCDFEVACPEGLQALLTEDEIFETEATTTARQIMMGRRDKYLFHQANVIPTSVPSGTMSLLVYWYELVLTEMAKHLNLQGVDPFPVRSVKFDDLCTNFRNHEELDKSGSLVTLTKNADGSIIGMGLDAMGKAGVIPVTVPTSKVDQVGTGGLPNGQPYAMESYGSDTTFYVATSASDEPQVMPKPTEAELAPIPGSAPVSPTPYPDPISPTPSPPSGYSYVGCADDFKDARVFSGMVVRNDPAMTTELCAILCKDSPHFGTQFGNECFCASSSDTLPGVGSAMCTFECAGDSSEVCGGVDAISVYTFGVGTDPLPVVDSPTYVGCFEDKGLDRIMSRGPSLPNMTAELCVGACPESPFVGTQYGVECWCGDESTDYAKHATSTTCTYPCAGDSSEMCGGFFAMSVYEV